MPNVPVIAQNHPAMPDFNAAWRAEAALSEPAAQLGQPGANPKICRSSRRHAQQIVLGDRRLQRSVVVKF
jgi:hypothetical protein